jgi:phosphoribosyl 1,2-cyclic phosphodiesterase
MQLRVLGSSSAGNTYLLESDTECLVLEAGLPFKDVKRALDFNVGKIVGVVCSHQHGDHFGHSEEYLKSGIPVYAGKETHGSLSKEYSSQKIVRPGYWYQIGGFNVTPFHCEHDVECYGYIIRHDAIGTLLFATDTAFIRENFRKINLDHILIECNYSIDIVNRYYEEGTIERSRIDRILKTHMELNTCRDFIKANMTASLDSIVLLHLSDENSNAEQFKETIQDITGKFVKVAIADKGTQVKLDLFPF